MWDFLRSDPCPLHKLYVPPLAYTQRNTLISCLCYFDHYLTLFIHCPYLECHPFVVQSFSARPTLVKIMDNVFLVLIFYFLVLLFSAVLGTFVVCVIRQSVILLTQELVLPAMRRWIFCGHRARKWQGQVQ